ncbi:MAG TPA: ABC transporter permease [bacterium]|nr:ABC transporter permease [bacterium]
MNLQAYVGRRLLVLPLMVLGITLLTFLLSHAVPSDPVAANLGDQAAADPAVVAAFKHRWGLDRPLPEQYVIYLANLVRGDMGISITTHQPVLTDLRQHLPATIELATAAMVLSLLAGIPLGIVSAVRRDSLVDQIGRGGSLLGVSMPVFWLGLVALFVFYARLGWAPSAGQLSPRLALPPFATGFVVIDALLAGQTRVALDALAHIALPACVLASSAVGIITRMMRGSMLEVLGEDYVRTARAKGLAPRRITLRHAARNALLPVITVVGLSFGGLLSGAVVTETVFAWPGLGSYAFLSATSLDFPAIMGVGIVVAVVYILVNLFVDITYAVIDPRIRMG